MYRKHAFSIDHHSDIKYYQASIVKKIMIIRNYPLRINTWRIGCRIWLLDVYLRQVSLFLWDTSQPNPWYTRGSMIMRTNWCTGMRVSNAWEIKGIFRCRIRTYYNERSLIQERECKRIFEILRNHSSEYILKTNDHQGKGLKYVDNQLYSELVEKYQDG